MRGSWGPGTPPSRLPGPAAAQFGPRAAPRRRPQARISHPPCCPSFEPLTPTPGPLLTLSPQARGPGRAGARLKAAWELGPGCRLESPEMESHSHRSRQQSVGVSWIAPRPQPSTVREDLGALAPPAAFPAIGPPPPRDQRACVRGGCLPAAGCPPSRPAVGPRPGALAGRCHGHRDGSRERVPTGDRAAVIPPSSVSP